MYLAIATALSAHPAGAESPPTCALPARTLVGDETIRPLMADLKYPEPRGALLAQFEKFQTHFNDLFAVPSDKYHRAQIAKALAWAQTLPKELDAGGREKLGNFVRIWVGILLRDVAPGLDAEGQTLILKRLAAFEDLFSRTAPDLGSALCLDTLLAETPEKARALATELKGLNEKLQQLNQYTFELEKELVGRLRKNPNFPDHWYHLASFLFARGRLEEAESQLRELFKLDPKHKKGNQLLQDIQVVQKIKNPVTRARRIEQIVKRQLKNAHGEYRKMLSGTLKSALPRRPANDPSGKPRPKPEFVE